MTFQVGAMAAGAVLATVADIGKDAANFHSIMNNSHSLVGMTSAARVEPLTLVDTDCVSLDYITDVLQSVQSLFTGYWLQALDMVSDVGGCSVRSILDPINPSRDPDFAEFQKNIKRRAGIERFSRMSVESYKYALPRNGQQMLTSAKEDLEAKVDNKVFNDISAPANLAVGKMINVTISNGGEKKDIPIAIRLMVVEMPRESLVALVGDGSQNTTLTERFFSWRAGRITMIGDLLLCNDLIKERKKLLAKDKAGVYTEVRRRQAEHKKAGMLSGKQSDAEASNIYVISKETAEELEFKFGLNIDNFAHRSKIFDNTAAMIIVVIDREYARVTFYHAGLRQSSNMGVQDIKGANKGGGPNIMDIFQAYKEGAAPRY